MILTIQNIGKIENATIELTGITVIAGENNTGKSTIGKILYCIFNSFYKIDSQIHKERQLAVSRIFETAYRDTANRITVSFETEDMAESILIKENI